MTENQPSFPWANPFDSESFTEASEDAMERQQQLFQQWMSMMNSGMSGNGLAGNGLAGIGALCTDTGTFKTRVQSGGRISIPDTEREALGIEEGDIVQTIVIPIKRNGSDE